MFGLFNKGKRIKEALEEGAIIIDVRTKSEFAGGHLKSATNIPLDTLSKQMSKLDQNKTIITCCASGMRSASAKRLLVSKGFQAINGGSWNSLQKYEH